MTTRTFTNLLCLVLLLAGCQRQPQPKLETTIGEYTTSGDRDRRQADDTARGFLNDIAARQLNDAFKRLSTRQKSPTFDQFRADVEKHPPLQRRKSFKLDGKQTSDTSFAFKGSAEDPDGLIVTISLEVVKEDGVWKIAKYVFRL